jgi:hypothetical protein
MPESNSTHNLLSMVSGTLKVAISVTILWKMRASSGAWLGALVVIAYALLFLRSVDLTGRLIEICAEVGYSRLERYKRDLGDGKVPPPPSLIFRQAQGLSVQQEASVRAEVENARKGELAQTHIDFVSGLALLTVGLFSLVAFVF